jgi:hypothetical protein
MIPSHYARIIDIISGFWRDVQNFLKLFLCLLKTGCGISSNNLLIYFLDVFICVYAANNRKR